MPEQSKIGSIVDIKNFPQENYSIFVSTHR
jgi:hypothetical protein